MFQSRDVFVYQFGLRMFHRIYNAMNQYRHTVYIIYMHVYIIYMHVYIYMHDYICMYFDPLQVKELYTSTGSLNSKNVFISSIEPQTNSILHRKPEADSF